MRSQLNKTVKCHRTLRNAASHYHVLQFKYAANTTAASTAMTTSEYKYSAQTEMKWKKGLRETQTLCAGCSKAEPKLFALPQTRFPGVWDGQNLISMRWSLPSPTNPLWWGSMHAISSYHGNRHTNTPTNTHTSSSSSSSLKILQSFRVRVRYFLTTPHGSSSSVEVHR